MMRYLARVIFVVASFLIPVFSYYAKAEIVVIVNAKSALKQLTRRQVVDIYTGRVTTVANGNALFPLDHPMNSVMRKNFYARLTGKSVSAVNAYWARLLFTGRALPPKELSDGISVLESIEMDMNAIGYMHSGDVSEKVKVVYKLKDHAQ